MASKPKTSPYDSTAVVKRIEDGVAWVQIPGGVDETPVKLTINAKAGDTVQVRVSGGTAFLVGNGTAPPTDDSLAKKVEKSVLRVSRIVNANVKAIKKNVRATEEAQRAADEADRIAKATKQHFWDDENGVHVSSAADNPEGTNNIIMNALGILLRAQGKILSQFSASQVAFYDGVGNAAENIVALFGASGAIIGRSGLNHTEITDEAFSILDGITKRFQIIKNTMTAYDDYGMPMFYVKTSYTGNGLATIPISIEPMLLWNDGVATDGVSFDIEEVSKVSNGTKFGIDQADKENYGGFYYTTDGEEWQEPDIEVIGWSTAKRRHHSAAHSFDFIKGTASTASATIGDTTLGDVYATVRAQYDGDHTVTFTCTSLTGAVGFKLKLGYLWLTTNVRRPCLSVGSDAYRPYSIVVGEGLYANSHEAVFGKYNVDFYRESYAMQVGGGTDIENPQDLFRVGVDGDVQFGIPDYATSGTEDHTLYNLIVSMGWGNPAYGNTVILDDDGVVI